MDDMSIDFGFFPNTLIGGTTGYGKTQFVLSEVLSRMKLQSCVESKFIICPSKEIDYTILDHLPQFLIKTGKDASNFCSISEFDTLL